MMKRVQKVYVVTAWNETTEEDYVAVFATRKLAAAAWARIKEKAGKVEHKIYGSVSAEDVVGA